MGLLMGFTGDAKVLWHLVTAGMGRGGTHQERLENFYRGQAPYYDDFREGLLPGRREMIIGLGLRRKPGAVWVDMGGGTGASLDMAGAAIGDLKAAYVVDLCPSLLGVAKDRIARRGWKHVHAVHGDATTFRPPEGRADVVTFSYSLSMMPDPIAALENALRMLAPGGSLGVVDFYVTDAKAREGFAPHDWWTRHFWPAWFAVDGVRLSSEVPRFLADHLTPSQARQGRSRIPYLPLGTVPYFIYLGSPRPNS